MSSIRDFLSFLGQRVVTRSEIHAKLVLSSDHFHLRKISILILPFIHSNLSHKLVDSIQAKEAIQRKSFFACLIVEILQHVLVDNQENLGRAIDVTHFESSLNSSRWNCCTFNLLLQTFPISGERKLAVTDIDARRSSGPWEVSLRY